MHVRAGVHTCKTVCVAACVCVCVCVCMFVSVHVQLPSSSVLVCVLCGLLSWLLFIKRTVGGYWAFPIHHQNTKHSPTLFYSLPATQHWSPSCECVFALIPFTLKLATTQRNILCVCMCGKKRKTRESVIFSVCTDAQAHMHMCISHSLLCCVVLCGCRRDSMQYICIFPICHMLLNILLVLQTTFIWYSCVTVLVFSLY